jgi:hypothetical protein
MNPEMGLTARASAGMALVLVRFIHNIKTVWRESGAQLVGDQSFNQHGT